MHGPSKFKHPSAAMGPLFSGLGQHGTLGSVYARKRGSEHQARAVKKDTLGPEKKQLNFNERVSDEAARASA